MNGASGGPSDAVQRALEYCRKKYEPPKKQERHFTIAISRQRGARGSRIAKEVGRRLGWYVYDRNLVDEITRDADVAETLAETVDERHKSWIVDCLEAFMRAPAISEPAFVHRLVKILHSLASRGECIVVGRGAGFLLPPQTTLRVGLVAPLKERIKRIASDDQISENDAAHQIKQMDYERRMFVKDHFHKDPLELEHYDVVLNTGRYSYEQCATFITEALERAMP